MTQQYVEHRIAAEQPPVIVSDQDNNVLMEQILYIWNLKFKKWHECVASFCPPSLTIVEFEDLRTEVSPRQLLHLQQKWFYGTISRREARSILQDFGGGDGSFLVRTSESFNGKFAISFVHESRVKHIVIESRHESVAGVLYNVTPKGPFFRSLYDLIEEAQKKPIIQNHMFDVKLGKCPPKPDMRWLHGGVKSLSQAEQILRKEHRDGAFFVYQTNSEYAPYIVAYRSNGSILHNLILAAQRPTMGYTLNNVNSPVLYKLIHYFMENPINGSTVLKFPVEEDPMSTNCGVAIKDCGGDRSKNELQFRVGDLITNISKLCDKWSIGDHRGDKQKFFQADCVRLLTRDEIDYIITLRDDRMASGFSRSESFHFSTLDLQSDYQVSFDMQDGPSSTLVIEPVHSPPNPVIKTFRHYKLACSTAEDLEEWYQTLQHTKCLPKMAGNIDPTSPTQHRKGCVIC